MSPLDRFGNYYAPDLPREDAAVASAARTASGAGTAFNAEAATSIEATLNVTAVAGTGPTLDVRLETSIDGGTTWSTVGSFAQQTAVGSAGRVFGPLGDQCRWAWTLAPADASFTFSISAEANR